MPDDLRDAMGRAVDRLAPFPPSAEALKKAAKRSQLRRRLIAGWLGLTFAASLGPAATLLNNDDGGHGRPNRRQVGAPVASDEPTPDEPTDPPGPGDGRCCASTSYRDKKLGFTVSYPNDWYRAEEKMTDIGTPRELFTLGTFSLEPGGSCMPTKALADVHPYGALVYAFEDQDTGNPGFFKPMPDELGLDDLEPPGGVECGGEQDVMRRSFKASGRFILLFVALGEEMSPEARQEVSNVLDSLHFEPLE